MTFSLLSPKILKLDRLRVSFLVGPSSLTPFRDRLRGNAPLEGLLSRVQPTSLTFSFLLLFFFFFRDIVVSFFALRSS